MISSGARLLKGKKIPLHLVPGSIADARAIKSSTSTGEALALGAATTAGGRAETIGDHAFTSVNTSRVQAK
jgi:hypothetical protein